MIDYSYNEVINEVIETFEMLSKSDSTTEGKESTFFYALSDNEPDMFYDVLAVTVYEVKNRILTSRMKEKFLDYAERFSKGDFQSDMIPEDIPIVKKDIAFVRSKIFV